MVLTQHIKNWIKRGLDLLYPAWCQICRNQPASPDAGHVCQECIARIKPVNPPYCAKCGAPYPGHITTEFRCSNCADARFHFDYARSAVQATGVALEIIHRYKYKQAVWFEPLLGRLLATAAAPDLSAGQWDLIVPVPLHPARERERGFNQAARLAMFLARATGIPVNTSLLIRKKYTHTQTTLNRRERARNMVGAFGLARHDTDLARKRIVLVDDVFTTGATTDACAAVLKRHGSAKVCVWTLARGV